jgi:hypothetical protein
MVCYVKRKSESIIDEEKCNISFLRCIAVFLVNEIVLTMKKEFNLSNNLEVFVSVIKDIVVGLFSIHN